MLLAMPNYRAEVPLIFTSSQRNDRLGFSTSWGATIDGPATWRGLRCDVSTGPDGTVNAVFASIAAADQGEAFGQVCDALAIIAPVMSLEVQRNHLDRHYGPTRVTWSRSDVTIRPSDDYPSTSVAMRMTQRVTLTRADQDLAAVEAAPELRPLLLSYDRALAPDDEETRFFNAFAIVEFVESRFATSMRFPPLLDETSANAASAAVEICLRERGISAESIERLRRLLDRPLRGTAEGREAKLLAVLHSPFGITHVRDARGLTEVDLRLVRQFTGARNRLFHGASGTAGLSPSTVDLLTLVVEQVLRAFLERRVTFPSPAA